MQWIRPRVSHQREHSLGKEKKKKKKKTIKGRVSVTEEGMARDGQQS